MKLGYEQRESTSRQRRTTVIGNLGRPGTVRGRGASRRWDRRMG